MNEMCIKQRYVIIAYLLADREQRILKSIKTFPTSGTRYAEPDNSKCDSQLQQLCRLRTYCVLG